MKRMLCILITLFVLMSSSFAYASSTVTDTRHDKASDINFLRNQLKLVHKDKDQRLELVKEILQLKNDKNNKGSNDKKDSDEEQDTSVFINGDEFDSKDGPVIKYDKIIIPKNAITKGLGAQLTYDDKTHVLTVKKGQATIVINLEKKTVTVNGKAYVTDVFTKNYSNRAVVLVKLIAELLGYDADTDDDAVIIEDGALVSINDSVTGTGNNQFEYVGSWNYGENNCSYQGDYHWSSIKDGYYQVRFLGSQIKLYGSKAPNYGKAAISLDRGTEKLTDLYAAKRADSVLIYDSGTLAYGQHILKVRTTGTKNSKSTNYYVVADRADVPSLSANDILAPTVPTGLNAAVISSSQIKLNWTASTDNFGVAGYKVYRNNALIATLTNVTTYNDTGLASGTTYTYSVLAYDAAGNSSSKSNSVSATTLSGNTVGTGLKGEYYNNMDFTDLKVTRVDSNINFNWGAGSPNATIDRDTFSARWTGFIKPVYSGQHTFYTISDDGVRLWINGSKVIDNWSDHSATENSGTITLTAGQLYEIKLEYYENATDAQIMLMWSYSNQSRQVVPESQLYQAGSSDTQAPTVPQNLTATPVSATQIRLNWASSTDNVGVAGYKVYRNNTLIAAIANITTYNDTGLAAATTYTYTVAAYDAAGNDSGKNNMVIASTLPNNTVGTGLKGEYYNNMDFTASKVTRVDSNINFNWASGSPNTAIDAETFSVRWTGFIKPVYSEQYTFYTISDDGVRLWINGSKVIDNWSDHSATENSGTITLTAGQLYEIKLEYYENTADSLIMLLWSSASQTRQVVPQSQLYQPGSSDTQAPTMPSSLTVNPVSPSQVNLSWNSSTDNVGVIGYKLYRNGFLVAAVTDGNSYKDTGLAASTYYVYSVSAYDAAGNNSDMSPAVVVMTPTSNDVNDNVTGTANNQFNYVGSWSCGSQTGAYLNDSHLSSVKDDYAEIKFYGTLIKLSGSKAPSYGIATVTIDGIIEFSVDYYSGNPIGSTVVFSSPLLVQGQHTLKIRVTGTRNSSSSGNTISIDKAEIFA